MRALVLTPGFVAEDGPQCVPGVVDLLRSLGDRHDLDIHALMPPPANPGPLTLRGITLRAYGDRSKAARFVELQRHLSGTYDLVWALWIDRTGPLGLIVSRMVRAPLALSVMSAELADAPVSGGYGWARARRHRLLLRGLAAAARATTVGSEQLVDRFRVLTGRRAARAPLGVPPGPIRAESSGRSQFRILAVTTLQPVKQPEVLVRALADLVRGGHDATLDVYGYAMPRDLDRLRDLARRHALLERVRHRGFVEPERLRARYPDYDLLLHASCSESQGMALIEAAQAGVPIACFDVGVARELAALGAPVVIAAPGALSSAAEAALSSPPSPAIAAVRAAFGLDACTRRFEAILEEAAACGSR